MTRKRIAIALGTIGITIAGVQWWQIVYRWQLFHYDFHDERFVNHVGDDVFTLVNVVNVLLLLTGILFGWSNSRRTEPRRWFLPAVATLNVLAWMMFIYMRTTGVLVGYMELNYRLKGH